jgi:hypothetical protein
MQYSKSDFWLIELFQSNQMNGLTVNDHYMGDFNSYLIGSILSILK